MFIMIFQKNPLVKQNFYRQFRYDVSNLCIGRGETRMSNSAKKAGSYNVATRGRLLDAAEHLFAERGIDLVTLKEIAQEAGGNVGQIVYHFGQKEELVRDVILRRAGVISAE